MIRLRKSRSTSTHDRRVYRPGARVPGATVTITNEDTGVPTVLVTNAAGAYSSPPLVLGRYTVKAELEGFKTSTASGILLEGAAVSHRPILDEYSVPLLDQAA